MSANFFICTSLVPELRISHIISVERALFCTLLRMPVYCNAYDCDNDQRNASKTVSFHHLPLKKSSLLKQVKRTTELC